MLPAYVEVASRMYRVLWLLENVLREYLETGDPSIVMTLPATKEEAAATLQAYIAELQNRHSGTSLANATTARPDRASKPGAGEDPLRSMRQEVASLGRRNIPPPATAISRRGRPLDFVFLRFLSDALAIRNPAIHRQIAEELTTLNAYRNAIMHFRDVDPDGFDHACSLTWRICHALSQDEQFGLWIGQWFGAAANAKRIWPRLLSTGRGSDELTCVDYGDLAVPPIGRFRPAALRRDGYVFFPGGLYKVHSSWTRLDPAWVAECAVSVRSAGTDRLIDAREYECWIVPEIKAATIESGDAVGPSGLRFVLGAIERRRGTSSAQTGFVVSNSGSRAMISDGIPAGHGDVIRSVVSVGNTPAISG